MALELRTKTKESYCDENNLKTNDQIKQFLKVRLSILLRSFEQNKTNIHEINNNYISVTNELVDSASNHNNNNNKNVIFIERLLSEESNLIKSTINKLST